MVQKLLNNLENTNETLTYNLKKNKNKLKQPWDSIGNSMNISNLDYLSLEGTKDFTKELGGKLIKLIGNFWTWIVFIILLFFAIILA